MTVRWSRSASLGWLLVLALTGCVAIPTSGPVVAGRKVENRLPRIDFFAAGPEGGESPREIVTGFLRAAADFHNDHLAARSFLSPASTWALMTAVNDTVVRAPDPATGADSSS